MKKLLSLSLALAMLMMLALPAYADVVKYDEPVTITAYTFSEEDIEFNRQMDEWILENYGVKVEYEITNWNDRNFKLLTDVASGNSKDIQLMTFEEYPVNISKGLMQPLDDLLDVNAEVFSPATTSHFAYAGKHYAVASQKTGVEPIGIFYNVTMFENNGLTTPAEYYANGEWTFETFEEVAMELTQDTDGDGVNDQYGYMSWMDDLPAIANGGEFVRYQDDGTVELAWKDPKTIAGMQMVTDMFNTKNYATVDFNNMWYEMFKEGRLAMGGERHMFMRNLTNDGVKFEFAWAPYPIGPDNTDGKLPATVSGYGIPVGAKNPEAAATYLYAMADYNNQFYEDEWGKYLTEDQLALVAEAAEIGRAAWFGGVGNLWGIQWDVWGALKWGGEDAASVVERFTPAWQAEVDVANQKFEMPTIEAFSPIAPIDFEDGEMGWLKTNAAEFVITDDPAEAIDGKSLKVTGTEGTAWSVLLYADYDAAPTPDYHQYTLTFDYKILQDMKDDYGLIVRARPYDTIFEDVNTQGWVTADKLLAGDTGTMTATLNFQGIAKPAFFIYAGGDFDFVIDNVSIVEAE